MALRIERGVIKTYDSGSSAYQPSYAVDPEAVSISGGYASIDLGKNSNFLVSATGTYSFSVTIPSRCVGQTGVIIVKNIATTSPQALPSNMKTPNGDSIAWQTDNGDIAIISYMVVDTSTMVINYIGNFS